jgi:hypothetical protein
MAVMCCGGAGGACCEGGRVFMNKGLEEEGRLALMLISVQIIKIILTNKIFTTELLQFRVELTCT